MNSRIGRSLASGFLLVFAFLSMSGIDIEPDRRKVEPRLFHTETLVPVPAREQAIGAPPAASATVPVFLRTAYDDPAFPERIRNLGGTANRIAPRIYTARLPLDSLRYASNWPSVAYIEAGRRVRKLLDLSRPAVLADNVQNGTGLPAGYTGQGALVGIVDTGLDGTHPDFLAGTPAATRVVHAFIFQGGGTSMQDTDGHGTHVAGIAAGNGSASSGLYTGMAPRSGLMIARAGISSFTDTDIITGVMDLFGYADSVGKPAAVNLSLGVMAGPHDGTSSFESAINFLATGSAGSRRLVSVAAGNEQDESEHYRAAVADFGSATATLSLLANGTSATTIVDVWADGGDRYTVTAVRAGETVTAASGSNADAPSGFIGISNRVDAPPNQGTHIQVFFSNPGGTAIPASVRFDRVRNGGSGTVDAYVDFLSGRFTGTGIATTGTTIEPANGDNVIATGSFQTKAHSGGAFVPGTLGISSFSSFGPTRDSRIKPDVAAPGEVIFSAKSSQASFPSIQIVPNTDNQYVIEAGTSMAAPHVAGIAALAWESNTALTGAQMRERLRRTADAVGASPNTTWGYGRVNALRAVRDTVASIASPSRATPGTPVSLTSENSSGGFGTPISAYLWSAPGAALSTTIQAGTTFTASAPGKYTVSLTATAGTSSGSDSRDILVNTIPTADFTVPAFDIAGNAVTFHGTASDPDGQPVTFRWRLVSRPAGSSASITGANVDNAVFTPDAPGVYEIGLRADDGLDNSALVVHAYTAGSATPAPAASSGGGGGCSTLPRTGNGPAEGESPLSAAILLLPAAALWIRRKIHARS